mgnify:CR=1 FL=1
MVPGMRRHAFPSADAAERQGREKVGTITDGIFKVMRTGCVAAALLSGLCVAAQAQQVPSGSYLQTCGDVQAYGGWLKAMCQDRSGGWVEAELVLSSCGAGTDIANENGRLVCKAANIFGFGGGGGFASERPPSGSYMATCRDIRVSAGWLKATCQDSRGRWVDATTATGWCSAGRDIANIDGRLTCR